MRAAAVALVLIVGAAVVLWYANTLNSWVLGGLIGGLAALLLSIPISLTLFSYLSRRHDEKLKAEAEEAMYLEQLEYDEYPEAPVKVFESRAYDPPPAGEWDGGHYQVTTARNLPVPSSPRLPVARQNQLPASVSQQRMTDYTLARQQRAPARGQPAQAPAQRRPATQRHSYYSGFYGYQGGGKSLRASQQTAALRAARLEAVQHSGDSDPFPATTSRSLLTPRRNQDAAQRANQQSKQLPARQSPSQPPDHYRSRRTVDGSPAPPGSGRLNSEPLQAPALPQRLGEPRTDKIGEPHTDKIGGNGRYPSTGSIRQQPQTGQMVRRPQIEAQPREPDIITGSLKNPLVRRAPYMYEDDPLREKLAQQLEPPSVRRSSRRLDYSDEED